MSRPQATVRRVGRRPTANPKWAEGWTDRVSSMRIEYRVRGWLDSLQSTRSFIVRRLRRAVIRCFRLAGPVLALATAFCIGGFSLHAVRDWHRHGEFGAGFFHLHFHVGEHAHEDPAHDDHDHETPTDEKQQRSAVLTIAQALNDDASAAQTVTLWEPAHNRTPSDSAVLPRSTRPFSLANPRAPPA